MKGNAKVIALLNDSLTAELTAVNQYFLHARMCGNWGYKKLEAHLRAESIDEMKHADQLITRILFLEGMPNVQKIGKVTIGQTVPEMFKVDYVIEKASVVAYNEGIELCRSLGDGGTRALLETILAGSEAHTDWLEEQQTLIAQIGEQNYLAQQLG